MSFLFVGLANASPTEQANLMPAMTKMVIQIDLDKLKSTTLFKTLIASNPAYDAAMTQFTSQSGIDAKKIKMVTVGFFDLPAKNPMAILLDVPFPAQPKGTIAKKKLGKQTYYQINGGAIAAPYKGQVLMTEENLLKHFVGKKPGLKGAMKSLSKSRTQGAQVWVFGTPPKNIANKAAQGVPDINKLQASINFATGINVAVDLETEAKFAKEAVTKFEAEKAKMAQNPMVAMMGLGNMINKMALTAKGKDLSLKLNLNDAEVNQLVNMVKMMIQQQAGATPGGAPQPPMMPAPVTPPATK